MNKIRVIATGGGTAGHIYPAIAVVEALERKLGAENVEVLFVGALGKMEMNIIPKAGYTVKGLPVRGLLRRLTFENVKIVAAFIKSIFLAKKIVKEFKPDVIIGFGGYASAAIFYGARSAAITKYIWEGNSFAGASNRALGRYASKVFVSYDKMERFFDEKKIVKSGNPIRATFSKMEKKSESALAHFGIEKGQKVVLITGGSLGARVLNESVFYNIDKLLERDDISVIWQTGSYYFEEMKQRCKDKDMSRVWQGAFIDNMQAAYSCADLIVCRSGASTVTEVALSELPALFIPSSGVTDDHQTKNAAALVELNGAEMLTDSVAVEEMVPKVLQLLDNSELLAKMAKNMGRFATADAADIIAKEIIDNE